MGTSQWRIVEKQRLLFRSWPDDPAIVCYDTASGDTHLLSALAAETLIQLQIDTSPLHLDALVSRVAASLGIPANAELVYAIEDTLSEFTERGLLAHN